MKKFFSVSIVVFLSMSVFSVALADTHVAEEATMKLLPGAELKGEVVLPSTAAKMAEMQAELQEKIALELEQGAGLSLGSRAVRAGKTPSAASSSEDAVEDQLRDYTLSANFAN